MLFITHDSLILWYNEVCILFDMYINALGWGGWGVMMRSPMEKVFLL